MIRTVIVEDDPMVAQINGQYLRQLGDFRVEAVFSSGREALEHLRRSGADLVILDVYMPSMNGSELLRRMRGEGIPTAVIMVTAATEMRVVDEALRLGIVDYLIKPYTFDRFQAAIRKFLAKDNLLKSSTTVDQAVVDRLLVGGPAAGTDLRKGLHQRTLAHVCEVLQGQRGEKHACESISAATGLSKVTVRRYLNYLIETGQVVSSIDYETGGRPGVLYRVKEDAPPI